MVENTSLEMLAFFGIGAFGSTIQLFIILLVSQDIRIIKNKRISETKMGIFFILAGGIITMIYASTYQEALIPSAIWKVFIVGIGWQGIIVSYMIAKKADDGIDAEAFKAANEKLEKKIEELQDSLKIFTSPNEQKTSTNLTAPSTQT